MWTPYWAYTLKAYVHDLNIQMKATSHMNEFAKMYIIVDGIENVDRCFVQDPKFLRAWQGS
jgi:hypothetical protein